MAYFSKYRLKPRQQLQGMRTNSGFAEWCKEVGSGIAVLLLALIAIQWVSDKAIAEDEAYAAAQKAAHIEQVWVSCLNNKAVWIDGELHTCSLANTRFAKADFK